MDFLRKLFSKKEKAYDGGSGWVQMYPSDVIERNLLENNKEWVFIATDKNANSVAAVRYKVMRYKKNGDDEEVFEGDVYDFLQSPAKQFTGKDFIYLNTAYKELTGNAFWKIEKDKTLRPLISTNVQPLTSRDGKLLGYKYTEGTKTDTFQVKEVLHDRYVDPRKPYWGVGKLEKIARWVDTNSYANEFNRLFFVNGAQFGGFIETDEESLERIALIKAGLQNEHVGINNAHKIAVLPKNSKFSPATANMSEMQFAEMDDRYRDKILAGFGVPKTLIGFTTEVNRASAEASEYIYAKYTVSPIVRDLIEFLNNSIVPLIDQSGQYYIACDEFIPENTELILKEREIALAKNPYKTINEVRAEVGLPPVKDGDVIPQANNQFGNPEPKKSVKHVPFKVRKAFNAHEALDRAIDRVVEKAVESVEPEDKDAMSHKEFVSRVDEHTKLLENKIRNFNSRQKAEVLKNLGRLTKAVAKKDIFDMDGEVGIMVDFITPLLRGLFIEQAIDEYGANGFEGSFDSENVNVMAIVTESTKRMAKSYNDTTLDLLKSAINDGIEAGDSLPNLAERVATVYDFSDKYRAVQVAHTESFYVANKASLEAYRQSGVVKTVRWYTSEDERVCEFCAPMNGRVIEVGKTFFKKGETVTGNEGGKLDLTYRTMDVPPLHPNCNCFIRAEEFNI